MTTAQRQAAASWISQAREIILVVGALLSSAAIVAGFAWWLFGGFKPQTQVDMDSLGHRVTVLEMTSKDLTTAQTATVNEIRNTRDAIIDRLNSMPRPTDYTAQDAHLLRLDEAVGRAGNAVADLAARVGGLEQQQRQQFRNPPPPGRSN